MHREVLTLSCSLVLCFGCLLCRKLLWIILHTHSVCWSSLSKLLWGFHKWKAEFKHARTGRKHSDKIPCWSEINREKTSNKLRHSCRYDRHKVITDFKKNSVNWGFFLHWCWSRCCSSWVKAQVVWITRWEISTPKCPLLSDPLHVWVGWQCEKTCSANLTLLNF